MSAKFRARSYGLRWHMIVDGRVASSVRSRREYVIKKSVISGSKYPLYTLFARRSPSHSFEIISDSQWLRIVKDAADRCEWARWEA